MSYALDQAKALRARLAAPPRVVVVPNLYPTPPALARRMALAADLAPGLTLLEPSCGTGALILAARELCPDLRFIQGVEVNLDAARAARTMLDAHACHQVDIWHGDFLECADEVGKFDRIIMNPPFDHGADIKHIRRAIGRLNPGGKLVALCAAGPRQMKELAPMGRFEVLEPGLFEHLGTSVRVALLTCRGK
jgi:precorrin-6B methylase 2